MATGRVHPWLFSGAPVHPPSGDKRWKRDETTAATTQGQGQSTKAGRFRGDEEDFDE